MLIVTAQPTHVLRADEDAAAVLASGGVILARLMGLGAEEAEAWAAELQKSQPARDGAA